MAQVSDVSIANQGFSAFRTELNNILAAFNTQHSGSSAPASLAAGSMWLDTSGGATSHILKFYDGTHHITFATINTTANTIDFSDSSITLADDSVTLAKMASGTDGNIISYDASGNPVAVATGSAGQVLTSAGAGAPPTFSTLAAFSVSSITGATALGATPADTDEFVLSDAGVLKRVDYSYIKGINATNFRPNVNPLIINGDMAVAQRSTSVTGITGSGYQTIDRYRTGFSGTLGTWTQSQSTDVPTGKGFANSFKMDCTTADASPAVGDRLSIRYNFEGQDLQVLKKGTSDAEKITLAFWVKSTKTGVHIINIVDQDNTRNISKSYTVGSSNTWEQVVLNFDGDTTGTLGDDNGQSLYIEFYLGAGTNYTSGTLATSWEAVNNTDVAVGQVNLADSTSNDFLFTGIQLEVGEYTSATLPPFQHESYGDNLARCQRYYEKSFEQGTAPVAGTSAPDGRVFASWDGASARTQIDFATTKRASPTVTVYRGSSSGSGTGTGTANFLISGSWSNAGTVSNHADDSQVSLTGSTSSFTANGGYVADMNFTANAEL